MKYTLRAYRANDEEQEKAKAENPPENAEAGSPIRFVASTEGVKRDGQDLSLAQWDLSNFNRNPVFLWSHDYLGRTLPIGRTKIRPDYDSKVLIADVVFDQKDEFARQVEQKYRDGFLHSVSVGWNTLLPEGKMLHEVTKDEVRLDLLDLSGVPVPGDPDALMKRFIRSLEEDNIKLPASVFADSDEVRTRSLPPHRTELAEISEAWEPDVRAFSPSQLRTSAAWVDDTVHASSPMAYRFLHHERSGEVVWAGLANAMLDLYLDTTGVPDQDRKGVYQHLVRHYQQFDKEPPEFLTTEELSPLSLSEVRGLFLEGEPEFAPQIFVRKGAVLSKRNLSDLDQAISILKSIQERSVKEAGRNDADPEETGAADLEFESVDDQLTRIHALLMEGSST